MKVAIASGKGGTGKTTVSVNLFNLLSKQYGEQIQLIDCDVEEPNDILFFPDISKISETDIFQLIPEIDVSKCTFCNRCSEWCEFNAITLVKNLNFAEVNKDLCHACGACSVACKFGAITEHKNSIGTVTSFDTKNGSHVIEGRLRIGSAMQTALIKETKKRASESNKITLFDAPPGTSCPVVETVADADYIILVTEPTPFGLNDLKIMVELLQDLKIPFGIIVNKAGLGTNDAYQFIEKNKIKLLGEIPFNKSYAEKYSTGNIFENIPDEIKNTYDKIINQLELNLSEL